MQPSRASDSAVLPTRRASRVLAVLALIALLLVPAMATPQGSAQGAGDPLTARAQAAQGLYFTGPYVEIRGVRGMINILRSSHLDAAVIDMKDAAGRVNYDSSIPELAEQENNMLGDVRDMNRQLHEAGIQTIARIVAFNDGRLSQRYPDRAILDIRQHRRGVERPWTSWGTGSSWLNQWDPRNHDMVVALCREAEQLGFDEIQLDYIRFPVDDGIPYAFYPHEDPNVRRRDLLLGLLRRIDEATHIPLGVDVFGIQAYWGGDASGLGQDLELWTQHVDIYSPMLYLNAMTAWEVGTPNRARRLVQIGISRMRERMGPKPIIRPFLQAFEHGAENWGPGFIAEQMRGARAGGADGILWWHPGSSFGMVQRAMNGPGRSLAPFPIPAPSIRAREGGS